jgi:hypothetical protein
MKKLLGFVCPPRAPVRTADGSQSAAAEKEGNIVEVLPLYAEDFLLMPRGWTTA